MAGAAGGGPTSGGDSRGSPICSRRLLSASCSSARCSWSSGMITGVSSSGVSSSTIIPDCPWSRPGSVDGGGGGGAGSPSLTSGGGGGGRRTGTDATRVACFTNSSGVTDGPVSAQTSIRSIVEGRRPSAFDPGTVKRTSTRCPARLTLTSVGAAGDRENGGNGGPFLPQAPPVAAMHASASRAAHEEGNWRRRVCRITNGFRRKAAGVRLQA